MSLALWEFFWDELDWTGTPAPTPPPGSGGGHGKGGKKRDFPDPYSRLDEDFWDVREAYLRAINNETLDTEPVQPTVTELPPAPAPEPETPSSYQLLPRYIGERSAAIAALRLCENTEQLKAAGARLIAINRAISAAKQAEYEAKRPAREAAFRARKALRKQKLQALRAEAERLLQSLNTIYKSRF